MKVEDFEGNSSLMVAGKPVDRIYGDGVDADERSRSLLIWCIGGLGLSKISSAMERPNGKIHEPIGHPIVDKASLRNHMTCKMKHKNLLHTYIYPRF